MHGGGPRIEHAPPLPVSGGWGVGKWRGLPVQSTGADATAQNGRQASLYGACPVIAPDSNGYRAASSNIS